MQQLGPRRVIKVVAVQRSGEAVQFGHRFLRPGVGRDQAAVVWRLGSAVELRLRWLPDPTVPCPGREAAPTCPHYRSAPPLELGGGGSTPADLRLPLLWA